MPDQLTKARGAFAEMPSRARYAILGIAAVTVVVMYLVVRTATGTTWVAVADGLPADKLGQAQTVLEEAGIENRVNDTRTAIEVPEAEAPKAASALIPAGIAAKGGRAGCARQSQEGGSLMAKTSAEFDLMLETCRESDVANTIESIEGVNKASVDVTVADDSLFSEDEQPAKAAVVVDTGGTSLSKGSIKGIQATVAASFKGLDPKNVTIADESGEVVGGDGSDDGATASMVKLEAESRLNAKIQRDLGSEIAKIVGPGNVVLTSNVELDMDEIIREVENHEAAGENGEQLVRSELTARELLDGAGGTGTQGVAGTGSNQGVDEDNRTVTDDGNNATAGDDGDYLKDDATREYANNIVAEAINVAPGTVTRFRIGAVVDDDVDPAAADAVKDLIQAWMGGNAEDSLAFAQAPIAAAATARESGAAIATRDFTGYVKWALLGLGLIGLAFVMRASLRQRTAELLAPADDLLLLESGEFTPIPIAELEAALAAGEPSAERRTRIEMQRKVEKIAESKPSDVANELRRWMHQDDVAYSTPRQRKAG